MGLLRHTACSAFDGGDATWSGARETLASAFPRTVGITMLLLSYSSDMRRHMANRERAEGHVLSLASLVSLAIALVLATFASTLDVGGWFENLLWFAALLVGTLGLILAYGVGITWTRRRKRLWG